MEPIFSREAYVLGWLKEGVVYDEAGQPRAFIHDRAVFNFDGQYVGRWENGYFRDEHGDAVAWIRGCHSGPSAPSPRVIPTQPTLRAITVKPAVRVVPKAAPPSAFWSEQPWSTYVQGMLEAK
jgi:hypothetical protein